MAEVDFLNVSTDQIRHQINQVLLSYNNDWDIFAEVLQNSVDAIRREKPTKGHIKLTVDALTNTIEIEDNGCGIDPKLLPVLLAPFSSDKKNSGSLIGSKGVGISFVIFSSLDFEIESHHSSGASKAQIVNAKPWLLPTHVLKKSSYISIREFEEFVSSDRSDADKRRKLKDKLVYHDGVVDGPGASKIRYWAAFVPKRKTWDEISAAANLIDKELLNPDSSKRLSTQGDEPFHFSGGMYTATRGMPTGIRTEMKTKGYSGYLPNFFIILDYSMLSFDIGRKSIPGRQLGMLRDHAADIFNNIVKTIGKHMSGDVDIYEDDWDKSSAFSEIRKLAELKSNSSKFLKRAFDQEASVAAIFFEMIGNGTIENIEPYVSGYKGRYDLFAKYKNKDVVIEFKHTLSDLFKDFNDEVKLFDQIDFVVIWDIQEKDRRVIETRGLDLNEESASEFSSNPDSIFHYTLSMGPVRPIKIICIRKLLDPS